jgi:hypothetical protein
LFVYSEVGTTFPHVCLLSRIYLPHATDVASLLIQREIFNPFNSLSLCAGSKTRL